MGKIHFYQGQNDKLNNTGTEDSKTQIKNFVKECFNVKNVHFLCGSGTSCGAIPTMNGLYEQVCSELKKEEYNTLLEEFDKIQKNISDNNNLEEILGILYSHRWYLGVTESESETLRICDDLIEKIECVVFTNLNVSFNELNPAAKNVLETYKQFYQKIALRNKDLSRINIFTTNNDLFSEMALDSINIHYINGFSGGLSSFFNPALFNYTFSKRIDTTIEKFEPVENLIYLYKLHGSINWIEDDTNENSYFKIKEVVYPLKREASKNILIYPTPTKQTKSLSAPYVDIFREFQKKILEPHSVIFIIGYSFSDDHVNNIIYRALATNSTLSVVIINDVEDKDIAKIDDNRIFRIFEKSKSSKKKLIHFFDNIVEDLIPDIDVPKQRDDILSNFVKQVNKK